MSSTIKVRKRRSFSAIPDDILEDNRMRTETRLVLGWLIGRPDGWEVRVGHVQKTLGISEGRWKTSRREMEKFGYLQQTRKKMADGTFLWEHTVTDTPKTTIGGFSTDGPSTDGETIDGKPTDITSSVYQEDLNTPSPYPFPQKVLLSSACLDEAQERFKGYSVSVLEFEWREAMEKRGDPPRNPDKAFLGWAAIYTKNHPLPYGGGF